MIVRGEGVRGRGWRPGGTLGERGRGWLEAKGKAGGKKAGHMTMEITFNLPIDLWPERVVLSGFS